ncbi:MAG: hypothetical protein HYV19_12975 [Gemmatimonadetes bacterium]|nr:hypothetical protein [Gemmatimonadota bacterium]
MRHRIPLLLACLIATLGACASMADDGGRAAADSLAVHRADSVARARQDSINRAQPGYVVDSVFPTAEEIRRFAAAVGGRPAIALSNGAASVDALVRRFAAAVEARDTVQLQRMALSPREFIDLVYPASPYVAPPYRQSPALTWSQIQLPSASGLRRLVDRLGGTALRVERVACPATPERQGPNSLYAGCLVTFASGGGPAQRGRLFGTIIAHGGQFKFVSYANMF